MKAAHQQLAGTQTFTNAKTGRGKKSVYEIGKNPNLRAPFWCLAVFPQLEQQPVSCQAVLGTAPSLKEVEVSWVLSQARQRTRWLVKHYKYAS